MSERRVIEVFYPDFSTILRNATNKKQKIEKSNKLLKLMVDLGAETRQIIAGIAKDYTPEDIIGKQVIVVANLKPAKLMGIISNGMLIAAVGDSGPTLAALDKPVDPGTPLR